MFQGWKNISVIVIVLACMLPLSILATPTSGKAPIRVAIFHQYQSNALTEISVRIFRQAALVLHKDFILKNADSKQQALKWLREGKVRVVAGPLRINDNKHGFDFVNSYVDDAVGIIIPKHRSAGLYDTVIEYFEAIFGFTVLGIFFVIIIFGILIWFFERKKNPNMYPKSPVKGIGTSIWTCLVTFSTVGYGDVVPKTAIGRFLTGLWIIVSLFLVSAFVASITSELTVIKSKLNQLQSLSELYNKKVAVFMTDTAALEMAHRYHVIPVEYKDMGALTEAVSKRKVAAGFANIYVFKDYIKTHPEIDVELAQFELRLGFFAYALRLGDALQPELPRVLYTLSQDGTIKSAIESVVGPLVSVKKG